MKNERVVIFDTTLRDGEQCPGASMTLREKLEVARQLARLKVDVIEAGFPVISQGDFDAVQAIAREVKGPIICGLARCVKKDIDAAGEALKPAGRRARIHVFLATSKIHREFKLGKVEDEIVRLAVEGVKRAKTHVEDVEFSPEDASRTEPEFLIRVCKAVIAAGATTVNIPDTVGWAMPDQFEILIKQLHDDVPEFASGEVVLSVHCHDDLGMAAANSLAAVRAGARQVECTINGIGERAGNAALEEIVMAIDTRRDFFPGVDLGVETRELLRTSRLVSRTSSFPVPPNKAVVGKNAFAHASGIHQDGILKKRETYEIMDPAAVGWKASELPLSKHSGRAAILARLKKLGLVINDEEVAAIFGRFKELADKKKEVSDEELVALAGCQMTAVPETWVLDGITATTNSGQPSSVTITLHQNHGTGQGASDPRVQGGVGDGPVDAAFKAVDAVTGTTGVLLDYNMRGASGGRDTLAEATVQVQFAEGAEPVTGKGVSTNIVEASARAYLNAVNRHLLPDGDV